MRCARVALHAVGSLPLPPRTVLINRAVSRGHGGAGESQRLPAEPAAAPHALPSLLQRLHSHLLVVQVGGRAGKQADAAGARETTCTIARAMQRRRGAP